MIKPITAESENEPGTLQYQVSHGKDDANEVRLWEEYTDEDAFEKHKEGKSFQAFAKVVDQLIDGELRLEKYHIQQHIKAKKPATGF